MPVLLRPARRGAPASASSYRAPARPGKSRCAAWFGIFRRMRTYVLRRLLLFVPTLLGASLLIFVLMRLVPGDIAQILVYQTGSESSAVQEKQIRQIRAELGLDRPLLAQYVDWLASALRGDFGQSYIQRRPVSEILRERVPRSLELAVLTLAIAVVWAVPLG